MSTYISPPFDIPVEVDPWIQSTLVEGALETVLQGGLDNLDLAVEHALKADLSDVMRSWGITDAKRYLLFVSGMLRWTPFEVANGQMIDWALCVSYLTLAQAPLSMTPYSPPIAPDAKGRERPIEKWFDQFVQKVGENLHSGEAKSQNSILSFEQSPLYNFEEALYPSKSGGWTDFNAFFTRRLKPGMRPISCPNDDSVVVSPADCTFDGAWPVKSKSNTVAVATSARDESDNEWKVTHVDWPINELLGDDKEGRYDFSGGVLVHAFLNTPDYHRQHAPVSGTVVFSNLIEGRSYLGHTKPDGTVEMSVEPLDEGGRQFLQTRGCVVIDNPVLGLVAVLPIGLASRGSVWLAPALTPDPGESWPHCPNVRVNKGDEISTLKLGGGEVMLLFQERAKMKIFGATGLDEDGKTTRKQKYLVGMPLGVSMATKEKAHGSY
ncbi:hypothetical protein EJ04DRAFT_602159 [Polyplosphaeria fusca]|uniref:Phosphatidylserine decarboxylase n=1 Tax=Polyplosphaeria fusca TaxID=682080 RepID=A0A9P4R104_9PLEO|nr:hypothetical protein EJ04DRAFT_602159 [Polyplosphaeria fusca]